MRDPDKQQGPTRAWLIAKSAVTRPDQEATIAGWLVNGPFHPLWQWWMLSIVHLRDLPGVPPAQKRYPEAEYEFMIVSLNPEKGVPDIDELERTGTWGDPEKPPFLTPIDVTEQFHGITDAQAHEIAEKAVNAILDGWISPDQDFRSSWSRVIASTIDHYRRGVHGAAH